MVNLFRPKVVKGTGFSSLLGDINQKQTRAQDKSVLLTELSAEAITMIKKYYPFLFQKPVN